MSKKSKMSRIMNGHYLNTKSSFYSSFHHTNNSKNLSRDDSNFDIEIVDPDLKRNKIKNNKQKGENDQISEWLGKIDKNLNTFTTE